MKHINDNRFGIAAVVKKTSVPPERMRYWESAGILHPEYVRCGTRKFRRYSREDIRRILFVKNLVDVEKYSLEGAIKKLKEENASA